MRPYSLILLHGFTGAPESFARTLAQLRTYDPGRLVVPSLPGHGSSWTPARGESEKPVAPKAGFWGEVDHLVDVLERAGISATNPGILVGYSLGARLALGVLLSRPEWFVRCVLVSVNPGLVSEAERAERRALDEARARRLREVGLDAFLREWEGEPIFHTQQGLPRDVLDEQARLRSTHTASGLAHSLVHAGLGGMPNFWGELRRCTVPMHLVAGELDVKFKAIAERIKDEVPLAKLSLVAQVGHNVPLEAPAELARILDDLPD